MVNKEEQAAVLEKLKSMVSPKVFKVVASELATDPNDPKSNTHNNINNIEIPPDT